MAVRMRVPVHPKTDLRDQVEFEGYYVRGQNAGRHFLGAVAVRFVPQTNALLGMNINEKNCYIEELAPVVARRPRPHVR